MTRLLFPLLVLFLPTFAGCTTCCHKAGYQSLTSEYTADPTSYAQRSKVYAILINGFDPLHVADIGKLGEELNRCGYAKVYTAAVYHQLFLEKEIRRIRCEEPDARFVVVGYSIGAGVAVSLTTRLLREGATIDALVEVAPVYVPLSPSVPGLSQLGRHIIIGSAWQDKLYRRPQTETILLEGESTGHYSVPNHPATVQTVLGLLKQFTQLVPEQPAPLVVPQPLIDDPAPIPHG